MLFQLNFPPSVPLPKVRWAFCCCLWCSPPCAYLFLAVK
nr:MAG TPA: hypothetical protein [Caudoviricetes sp.]